MIYREKEYFHHQEQEIAKELEDLSFQLREDKEISETSVNPDHYMQNMVKTFFLIIDNPKEVSNEKKKETLKNIIETNFSFMEKNKIHQNKYVSPSIEVTTMNFQSFLIRQARELKVEKKFYNYFSITGVIDQETITLLEKIGEKSGANSEKFILKDPIKHEVASEDELRKRRKPYAKILFETKIPSHVQQQIEKISTDKSDSTSSVSVVDTSSWIQITLPKVTITADRMYQQYLVKAIQRILQQEAERQGLYYTDIVYDFEEMIDGYTGYANEYLDNSSTFIADGIRNDKLSKRVRALYQVGWKKIREKMDEPEAENEAAYRFIKNQERKENIVSVRQAEKKTSTRDPRLEKNDEIFREKYLSKEKDINPFIKLDRKITGGNHERYTKRAKELIKGFFTPKELLALHNSIQKLSPADKVVKVADMFEQKNMKLRHEKAKTNIYFEDCNNFVYAVYAFCGLGTEDDIIPLISVKWGQKHGRSSIRRGEIDRDFKKINGKRQMTNLEHGTTDISKDKLPRKWDRIYLLRPGTGGVMHSAIALSDIEIHEVNGQPEAWVRIISQANRKEWPIIEPRRIVWNWSESNTFTKWYYNEKRRRRNKEFVDWRYRNKRETSRRNTNTYGHVIKKIIRP